MKKLGLIVVAGVILAAVGCSNGGGNNTVAAVPQAGCGNGVPSQYCTPYSTTGYGYNTYGYSSYCGNNGYSGYSGYGYSNTSYGWGYQQPCYPQGVNYGCPVGYQMMALGYGSSSYTCVAVSYLTTLNINPYYEQNYAWPGGYSGWGPGILCNPAFGSNQCGYNGAVCYPVFGGTQRGICRRPY